MSVMDGRRSFTIAPPGAPETTTTRLRNSRKEVVLEASSEMHRRPSNASREEGEPEPAEDETPADSKRRKKNTVRQKNQALAKAKSELTQARGQVGSLIRMITQTSQPFQPGEQQQHRFDRNDSVESLPSEESLTLPSDANGSSLVLVGNNMEEASESDLLESMTTLTKLLRKLTQHRDLLENSTAMQKKHIESLEARNQELFAQLEVLAMKLKDEKAYSSAARVDLEFTYRQQLKDAAHAVEVIKAQMAALRTANRNISQDLEDKEIKLMEVPRLEESYLRTARGLVRQKEKLVLEKEVKIRGLQLQSEQAEFWRQKATLLSEESIRKDKELADLKRQNMLIAHNYRQVAKQSAKLDQQLLAMTKRVHAYTLRGRSGTSSPSPTRPASPSSPPSPGDEVDLMEGLQKLATEAPPNPNRLGSSLPSLRPTTATATSHKQHFTTNTSASHSQTRPATAAATAHDEDEDYNAKEVKRLRGVVDDLNVTIKSLHFKLAQARAYPLLHTQHEGDAVGDPGGEQDRDNRFVGKVYVSELDELFDPADIDNDADEQRDSKEASTQRLARALSMQRDFNARIDEIRGKRPASAHFLKSDKVRSQLRR